MLVMGAQVFAAALDEGAVLEGVLFVAAAFVAPAVGAVVWMRRSRIVCSDEGVEIVRLFTRDQYRWDQIVTASPGYAGTELVLSDGSKAVGAAVQKANLSVWLRRRTRADELADLINSRATGRPAAR